MKRVLATLILVLLSMAAIPAYGAGVTDKSIGGLIGIVEEMATTEMWVGGGAGNVPVKTTVTGTGAPVLAGSPTFTTQITTPVITNSTSINIDLGSDAGDDFLVDTTKLVVEGDTGNVGIGTATPGAKLGIIGANASESNPPPINLALRSTYNSGSSRHGIGFYVNAESPLNAAIVSPPNSLAFYTTSNYTTTEATERMRIDSSGNVGIGTTTPASLLEAEGGLTTTGSVFTLGTKEPTVVANDVLGRINFYAPLEADGSDAILPGASIAAIAEDTFSATVNKTSLVFQTGASETASTKMTIKSDGNVGIGTTTPGEELEVNGTIEADDIKLTTGATVGYTWKCTNVDGSGAWTDVGTLTYKGTVDGDDGTTVESGGAGGPLIDGTGTNGDYYWCVDAGTYDYGNPNGNSITLAIGDWIAYNGATWSKIEGMGVSIPTMTDAIVGGAKLGSSLDVASDVLNIKDGDKGDITVSSSGTVWSIDDAATWDAKAPTESPEFTGTVIIPTPFTLGAVSVLTNGTELNLLDGLTASAAELNILDGVTGVTAAELSYIGDVTSPIQAQLALKVTTGGALGTPSSGTLTSCTFPTLNQNTTGSAATLTTTRTIWGQNFNGSANVTGALTGVTGITTSGGYTQSGTSANTFTGSVTMPGTGIWTSSNEIGLGTTSPSSYYDYADSLVIYEDAATTGGPGISFIKPADVSPANDYAAIAYGRGGAATRQGEFIYRYGITTATDLMYWRVGSAGADFGDDMTLSAAGDLTVAGCVISSGACADYVFDDTYNLMPVDELKTYISDNKHLPGMTINKGGQMSFNQAIHELLVKVEEQSRYIVELHERLSKLEGK